MTEPEPKKTATAGLLGTVGALSGSNGRLRLLLEPRDRVRFALLLVGMVFGAVLELISLASIQLYAGLLAKGTASLPAMYDWLEPFMPEKPGLFAITAGLIAILVFKLAFFAAIFWSMASTLAHLRIRLSARLFRAYQYAPYAWHLARPTAQVQRGLREDVNEVIVGLQQLLQLLLSLITAIAIGVFLVLALPAPVVLGLLVTIGLFVAISVQSHRLLVETGRRRRIESTNAIEAILQGLGALTEARILGRRKWFEQAFKRAMTGTAHATRVRTFIQQISPVVVETVLMIAMMLMIAAILELSSSLEAALQIATALALAVFRLRQVLSKATSSLNAISGSWPSFSGVSDDLIELSGYGPSDRQEDDEPLPRFQGLRFEDVSFSFPGQDTPALDRVSLSIARGQHVAIAGSTGAGKSTLVALTLGLLEPGGGKVLVDGEPVSGRLRQWHRRIGYVPQAIYLIDDTIAANVALGINADKIDRERVWEVLETAGLAGHVKKLPEGIDTPAGEQGTWLSGGQRQRIGIARSLYHRPEVLILDEATSALDLKTEKAILQALLKFSGDLTVIAVTHRIDSVKSADQILLLAHGRLAATGTYQELVASSAEFREVAQTKPARGIE